MVGFHPGASGVIFSRKSAEAEKEKAEFHAKVAAFKATATTNLLLGYTHARGKAKSAR